MSDIESNVQTEHIEPINMEKRKVRAKKSLIWTKFTIINEENDIASCNICGATLSCKTSASNLKKHLIRVHKYGLSLTPPYQKTYKYEKTFRHALEARGRKPSTELGGMEGFILNVVGEEGEDPTMEVTDEDWNPVKEQIVYTIDDNDTHRYSVNEKKQEGAQHSGSTRQLCNSKLEKNKQSRIMDLQMECLEMKKYTMQMEALLMERELCLPRTMFTEHLKSTHTNTRGTQTDTSGGNMKVFYVLENTLGTEPIRKGGQHLIE